MRGRGLRSSHGIQLGQDVCANEPAVIGTLKGYDQLMNLVLDEVKEAMTGEQPCAQILARA